jgi:hypothetical protein
MGPNVHVGFVIDHAESFFFSVRPNSRKIHAVSAKMPFSALETLKMHSGMFYYPVNDVSIPGTSQKQFCDNFRLMIIYST